ncbi:MAG: hypothetical protein LC107_11010 [Chitinophagales bacterium]|nr:hypothetical protein [Chitinophagales bacterium]
MSINKLFLAFVLTVLTLVQPYAANPDNLDKVKAINNYINFSNESTHGMLIVHRLLENFNKNINKFVDLPDQQINFYSNKDLPEDIFEDPEHWFYETSPNSWYNKILTSKGVLPTATEVGLLTPANKMKAIIVNINKVRFDLETQINTLDLTQRENLGLVYDKLEEAVVWYKEYYKFQQELESNINKYFKTLNVSKDEMQFPEVLKAMTDVYETNRAALNALYFKDDDNYKDLYKNEVAALDRFKLIKLNDYNSTRLINAKVQTYWSNIIRQFTESLSAQKQFMDVENIPQEFKLYDKYYYYYNISVINKFNRYGNGIVYEMNRIIDYLEIPMPRYFEMPHYFKVIYPKILDQTEYLASSDPVISFIPETVKGRSVVLADHTIFIDSSVVKFQMYDHKIIDGDIVSISFNGDWIIEKFMITEKPYEFTLKMNEQGKNFLLLHADDMGRQPPATIALSYMYKGKRQLITLNSDTAKSEVIEIVVKE